MRHPGRRIKGKSFHEKIHSPESSPSKQSWRLMPHRGVMIRWKEYLYLEGIKDTQRKKTLLPPYGKASQNSELKPR